MTFYVEWRVGDDTQIPPEVTSAAARGVPIVALVPAGTAIDGQAAELLEECAAVVRGDDGEYASKLPALQFWRPSEIARHASHSGHGGFHG